MSYTLPPLPWAKDALAPKISQETIEYHYGKHHQGYVNKLNALAKGTDLKKKSVEEIIKTEKGKAYNLAAQIFNHTFYWQSMGPGCGGEPTGKLAEAINASFGDFASFKKAFTTAAGTHFGSGWAWLVKNGDKLEVCATHDAGCPLSDGKVPILCCDVWEHAYYVDYRNARASYIEAWWSLVNWKNAEAKL
eukprot:CAMPEP_0168519440 /NCGR_PEP_ID=MMETSP0405-20121227/7321_1 /TAXON_ID=498012 /ORGANISM="Trichosphaerium sp, Strain Am-I-7 wt" /LENGTH=190 /DNA_ID=CAMNT_0008539987 /DNA_START=18 /DNA_END=591 /DNA_ORIENTATION=+